MVEFNHLGMIRLKSSLCLSKHHTIKTYWGSGGTAHLTSALEGDEWSASRRNRFTPDEGPAVHIE